MQNSASWNQSMQWYLLWARDDTRCSGGVIWERTEEKPKADHSLTALMWNSQTFPSPAWWQQQQQLQVSNWEPNVFLLVPVSHNLYRYNANCSEETADGILRFLDASGQESWWHGLPFRPGPYTHSEWELWALLKEWKKGPRKVWSSQNTSGNSLTKPRENFLLSPCLLFYVSMGFVFFIWKGLPTPWCGPTLGYWDFSCCEDMLNNHASMHSKWQDKGWDSYWVH